MENVEAETVTTLAEIAIEATTNALASLVDQLEGALSSPGADRGGGSAPPAELGIPVSWVRRRN
jgi:hypothetical protein